MLPLTSCNVSTRVPRLFVPSKFRCTILDSLHSLAHPGVQAAQNILSTCYAWLNINKVVHHWSQPCLQCQKAKVHRRTVTPLVAIFSTPDARFGHIHFNIVGPLL